MGALVGEIGDRLRRAGSPSPRLDAELLVGHAAGRDRSWVLAHPEAEFGAEVLATLDSVTRRRETGEPIAYIRGYKEWLSLRVKTDQRALIPRPETELLAAAAIDEVAGRLTADGAPHATRAVVAWEVATGSGAVALALARRFRTALRLRRLRLLASDVSPEALELASENLEANGVADLVSLVLSDLLEAAADRLPAPDVVIANLPYVPTSEIEHLAVAASFEPRAALDGGPDGLMQIRRLLSEVSGRVASGGVLLLEVGAGQADAVEEEARRLPAGTGIERLTDLAGIPRVMRLRLPAA